MAIQLRGTFRYATRGQLELALAKAHTVIDGDEIAPAWMRDVERAGATLRVDVSVPLAADQYVTAAILQIFATFAIDGVVEAMRDGRCIDWFAASA